MTAPETPTALDEKSGGLSAKGLSASGSLARPRG